MKLANEKSLELNLTHQLLSAYQNAYAVGSTQREELKTGTDSKIHCSDNIILFQYKAAYKGVDGQNATFRVNNNTYKDQHVKLKAIAQRLGQGCVYYVFPLVLEDDFFRMNSGSLLAHTVFVDVGHMPMYKIGDCHKVAVNADCSFTAFSEKKEGKGINGEEFVKKIIKKEVGYSGKAREEELETLLDDALRESYKTNKRNEQELRGGTFRICCFNPCSPKVTLFRWNPTDMGGMDRELEDR